MGYRSWDPVSRKIICSNDVIFHEACKHRESTGPLEVKRITMEDDTHQGQQDSDNRPVQQQVQPDIQPNDAAVDGNNDVPDVTNDLPVYVPLVDELQDMVLQPHDMQEIPDVQPPIQGIIGSGDPPGHPDHQTGLSQGLII